MRIAQLVVLPIPEVELVVVDELPDVRAGRPRLRLVAALMATPRVRVAAADPLARARPALPPGEAGQGVLAAPRRRRRGRRDARRGAAARARRGARAVGRRPRLRGADRRRGVDRAGLAPGRPARRPHRLRRRSLEPLARGLRGERRRDPRTAALLARGARGDRPPPADEAVRGALAPGRPGGVPRLALDPLSACNPYLGTGLECGHESRRGRSAAQG